MRLIDADALKEKAWDADTRCGYVQVVDVVDIDDAPTIEPDITHCMETREKIIMPASEAAKRANEVRETHVDRELQRINSEIEKQVNLGRFQYTYQGVLTQEVKKVLENNGYGLKIFSDRNEDYTIIKW